MERISWGILGWSRSARVLLAATFAGALAVSGCGNDSGEKEPDGHGGEGGGAPVVPQAAEFEMPSKPVEVSLRLNQLVYESGDEAKVELDLGNDKLGQEEISVALVSEHSQDVEVLELSKKGDLWVSKQSIEIKVVADADDEKIKVNDGVLIVPRDELFFALLAAEKESDLVRETGVGMFYDFAFGAGQKDDLDEMVMKELSLSADEEDDPKQPATLLAKDGYPVQIATHELMAWPASDEELELLLERTGGSEIKRLESQEEGDRPIVLVQVDPAQASKHLNLLRSLRGDDSDLFASREEGLEIYSLVLELQLEGFIVAVHPKLQPQGAPEIPSPESSEVTHTMKMVLARGASGSDCIPGDASRPCVENVPALWAFQDIFDKNEESIPVGVLDIGFAPNADFREPSDGFVECDMSVSGSPGYRCGAGRAVGPATVGASLFGEKIWHGTGVITTLGGAPLNNFGASGVAGQVAEPMMYNYNFASYAFEIGRGMMLATDDGASCINISYGLPCNIVTGAGVGLNFCTLQGRGSICAILTAAVHAAAAVTCLTLGPIPIVGGILCGAATGGAVAATTACVSTLALGDLSDAMSRGVTYATRRGVPVVTVAGNRLTPELFPDIVRELIELDNFVTEDWGIMPAMHPDTIVVGAVGSNLQNIHFVGDRVDIWAPIESSYRAPPVASTDPRATTTSQLIGGTSAATPYITGVIASMQAANPELNPRSGEGNPSRMVREIKSLLLADENTFSNSELVGLGYSNEPARRKLVNPLAAVQAAAQAFDVPDLEGLGYDLSLNYSELLGEDDSVSQARPLTPAAAQVGTIYTATDSDDTPSYDVDFYSFEAPSAGSRAYAARLDFRYLVGFDALNLEGDGLRLISRGGGLVEEQSTYVKIIDAGGSETVSVSGTGDADNLYKLSVEFEPADYASGIAVPGEAGSVCMDRPINLRAWAVYLWDESVSIDGTQLEWFEGSNRVATGASPTLTFAEGEHTLTLVAFGDTEQAKSVTFSAVDCVGQPPEVQITAPDSTTAGDGLVYDGYDDELGMYYVDVEFTGISTDLEDGSVASEQMFWTTDRSDLQEAELGEGNTITVRLYSNDCFGVTHRVRLIARDSDGNLSQPVYIDVFIYTLC